MLATSVANLTTNVARPQAEWACSTLAIVLNQSMSQLSTLDCTFYSLPRTLNRIFCNPLGALSGLFGYVFNII